MPGLGLKQGLEQDRVVAPYATAMATMLAPREALENFRRLAQEGAEGAYGFYEAIDYTPDRLPKGKRSVVVRSYMAHHQGMSLVALTNALLADVDAAPVPRRADGPGHRPAARRSACPATRRSSRPPRPQRGDAEPRVEDGPATRRRRSDEPAADHAAHARRRGRICSPTPQYHVMLTNAGSGSSTCRGLDVTRWREDADPRGLGPVLLRPRRRSASCVWSAGYQPVCRPADEYEVIFAADKATFRRRDADDRDPLEVTVSPEQPAEVRRSP